MDNEVMDTINEMVNQVIKYVGATSPNELEYRSRIISITTKLILSFFAYNSMETGDIYVSSTELENIIDIIKTTILISLYR